ncbi:hypothetical protein TM1040_3548 (plasmid) [Ruegeria sp. TM1040]|uniref:M48 family metallopeptidase n=1 Tax=Ruegeria sp. (strain TM1040) TaxID=292414 RepID=UPI0000462A74|nr:SprT family zinc-dependent metalloprotease [Ruegeria sp. TM1040]ABF62517.1 hypothetical protein TM1040_3548 [Ruegeria sp. TM1040]
MVRLVLTYGDERIPYDVSQDERRTSKVAIHVDPDGSVSVEAPPGFSECRIAEAVQRRARWVIKHVQEARERHKHRMPKEYVSGEQVLYLGRRYVLKVIPVDGPPKPASLVGSRLQVETQRQTSEDIRARVRAWYKVRGRDYLARRLEQVSKSLPWVRQVPALRLLEMKRQWGSCSPSGEIIVNTHLVKAPRPCIDYVLIHELAHLKHHDHGPEFWSLLDNHAVGWRKDKAQLDNLVEILTAD